MYGGVVRGGMVGGWGVDTGGGEMLHAVGKCPPQVKEKGPTQVAGVRGRSPLVSQLCGPYETVITQQSYTLYQ